MKLISTILRPPYLYVATCAALFAVSFFLPETQHALEAIPLEHSGKATLDYLGETTKLALALNSALFSAAATLAIKGKDWSSRWQTLETVLIVIVLVLGAISYYGIYKTNMAILSMVFAGAISPSDQSLEVGLEMQYYGTLLGLFLIGLIFTRMLEAKIVEDKLGFDRDSTAERKHPHPATAHEEKQPCE